MFIQERKSHSWHEVRVVTKVGIKYENNTFNIFTFEQKQ